jgi:predicted nucleotidyltransferase component of viral defense system
MLASEAETTGFRPDVLEKVAHLLGLLNALRSHPFLKGKLVLKGGTALTLFVFDVPRLSVDIDLNYVGSVDRETMFAERPKLEQAFHAVFDREGFEVRRMPEEHAGGKWSLRYESALGYTGNLEVDLNFMYRVPLWPVKTCDSHRVGAWRATQVPVLDQHELAAGKLAALLVRRQARDLFDSHRIFQIDDLDSHLLRIGFVVYGAMNRKDWRTVSVEDVTFDTMELAGELLPTLRANEADVPAKSTEWAARLVSDCRNSLSAVLPFTDSEREFLDLLLDKGENDPALLTGDPVLQERIRIQPLLEWKVLNVRKHKGLS